MTLDEFFFGGFPVFQILKFRNLFLEIANIGFSYLRCLHFIFPGDVSNDFFLSLRDKNRVRHFQLMFILFFCIAPKLFVHFVLCREVLSTKNPQNRASRTNQSLQRATLSRKQTGHTSRDQSYTPRRVAELHSCKNSQHRPSQHSDKPSKCGATDAANKHLPVRNLACCGKLIMRLGLQAPNGWRSR